MIAFVDGRVAYAREGMVAVDVGGVGYEVMISGYTLERLPAVGEQVRLYTHLSVREDAFVLFGFLSREELALFRQLISVSGIGPKGAQAILSVLSPDDLRFAIATGDAKTISRAPGIGKKTAERLVLELRDKLGGEALEDLPVGGSALGTALQTENSAQSEAVAALVALGYGQSESVKAVRAVMTREDAAEAAEDTEAVLKLALKELI